MTRWSTIALAALCAILAPLVLAAAPAMAAQIHVFSNSFSLPNSGTPLGLAINQSTGEVYASDDRAGVVDVFEASGAPDPTHPKLTQADGITTYQFSFAYGVAVDNAVASSNRGDIYVADYSAGAVLQFNPSGARTSQAPITAATVPVALNNTGFLPTGVAIGPDGDIYVADSANNVVDVFQPSGTFVSQLGAGRIAGPNAIEVTASGNLYVAQNGSGLTGFEPSGACLNSCESIDPSANLGVTSDLDGNIYAGAGGKITEFNSSSESIYEFGEGTLVFGRSLAFNEGTGAIYVADEGAGKVDVFKSVSVPTLTIRPFTSSGPPNGTLNGVVDPAGAGNVTDCHFEYGVEKGNYGLGTLPCLGPSPSDAEIGTPASPIESPTEVHGDLAGLATLKAYHYRLVATDANGTNESADREFSLLPNLPSVGGTFSSGETPTTATLSTEINPGLGNTVYRFQYGTTKSYEFSTLLEAVGSDGTDHLKTAVIAGLVPSTTYHFRAVAVNYVGTTDGPDQTFKTPDRPTVGGASFSNVTSSTATLEAQINPVLSATSYHFQYGTGSSYGLSTPESPSIGSDNTVHAVSAAVTGLAPATTYHFRTVATNRYGVTKGFDQTFTTASASAVRTPPAMHCKKGFMKRHGKCVKKVHHGRVKKVHHGRGGAR